jgi:hypothetical protein
MRRAYRRRIRPFPLRDILPRCLGHNSALAEKMEGAALSAASQVANPAVPPEEPVKSNPAVGVTLPQLLSSARRSVPCCQRSGKKMGR